MCSFTDYISQWSASHACSHVDWPPSAIKKIRRKVFFAIHNYTICLSGVGLETRAAKTKRMLCSAFAMQHIGHLRPVTIGIHDSHCNQNDYAFCTFGRHCKEKLLPWWTFADEHEVGLSPTFTTTIAKMKNVSTYHKNACGWVGRLDSDARPDGASPARVYKPIRRRFGTHKSERIDIVDSRHERLSIVEQVKRWKCLIDIRGAGFSQRVPILLHAPRVLVYVQRPMLNTFLDDSAFPSIRPWVHYIPVREDLEDLERVVEWTLNNDAYSANIRANAQRYARRYLTIDTLHAFLRRQILS